MKKVLLSIGFLFITAFTQTAVAQFKYLQGRDYQVLENPLPLQQDGQKEVLEFFSYACGHCAQLNPDLIHWKQHQKPANVGFYQIPALGGGWTFPGRVKLTAEKLGLDEAFDEIYFAKIHQERQRQYLGDSDAAVALLAKHAQVDKKTVEKAWDSLAVKNNMYKAAKLFEQSGITGVPTLVVNGKYTVSITAAGAEHLFAVVDFLLTTTQP